VYCIGVSREEFDGRKKVVVKVERLDCVLEDGKAKILSDEEKEILLKIRQLFRDADNAEIHPLKDATEER